MLGLKFEPREGVVRLTNPVIPSLAGTITIRNLTLGGATADVVIASRNGRPALNATRVRGNLRLLMD
jgi:hypothetical protein